MDKFWPVDELRKPIKAGDEIHLDLQKASVISYVLEVEPSHIVQGPAGPMVIEGKVRMTTVFERTFDKDHNVIFGALVLKKPEESLIETPKIKLQ